MMTDTQLTQIRSAVSKSQFQRRSFMTGFSLVPCAFLLMTDSSAMTGYLPVLAELLNNLLNKLRWTPVPEVDLPAMDLATLGLRKAEAVVAVAAVKRVMLKSFILFAC